MCAGDEAAADARRRLTRDMWRGRLRGVQRNVEVWQALLSVRQLVLPPELDRSTSIKFSSLCRKFGRIRCGPQSCTFLDVVAVLFHGERGLPSDIKDPSCCLAPPCWDWELFTYHQTPAVT